MPFPDWKEEHNQLRSMVRDFAEREGLEFETTMEGKYVNGVDIITCNDEGRIVEFRVMIRPLQAIQTVHAQMARMLESMKQ